MARLTNPIRFSEHFGFDVALLKKAGVLNPTLNLDTRLFIDPLLLETSRHSEIRDAAKASYDSHFTTVIKLLRASTIAGDVPWRNALRYLSFPEIKWTCLGYGAQSVSGSGSGAHITGQLIETAKQIVDLGIEDPDLFVAMALFEEGFGPDRISDMTANVILGDLLQFNARILKDLPVKCTPFRLQLRNGKTYKAHLPRNTFVSGNPPVILLPTDILRNLPIVNDWSDVAAAAAQNEELRNRVNQAIAKLWAKKSIKDKTELRRWALSGKKEFEDCLAMIHSVKATPYDLVRDPQGEVFWLGIAARLAATEPFTLRLPPCLDLDGVVAVVEQIIQQFRILIEERRLSEELYHDGQPRPEKAAQRLFFAVAYAYCKANNLDLTPEADTGNGPVDFKVASGFSGRVLVEIKLSTNRKLVKGYTRQLRTYMTAEEAIRGYYVVVDVGQMGSKAKALLAAKNEAGERKATASPIVFVDGSRRPSASKL